MALIIRKLFSDYWMTYRLTQFPWQKLGSFIGAKTIGRNPAATSHIRLLSSKIGEHTGKRGTMNEKIVDLSNDRKAYATTNLLEKDLPCLEPFGIFNDWFQAVKADTSLIFEEVNAAALSTVSSDLRPSCRMVLIKSYGKDGYRFFTNYNSRKGEDLAQNPNASLLFYWPKVHRQVRVEGRVQPMDPKEADEYWNKRPLQSRASSIASEQSKVVPDRQYLLDRVTKIMAETEKNPEAAKRPDVWGSYLLVPDEFEFWQGQSDRLHDRIRFRLKKDGETLGHNTHKGENGWVYERLAP